ncbi:MAG: TIGR02302 family protein [Alphaproteobacteria bacterium]|nr:TIGR02302 family protein [Alphaproteobacteria bacterium]
MNHDEARLSAAAAPAQSFGLRLALARLALLWERLWPALWPALGAAGLFLLLALLDVFPRLPGQLHAALLVLFAAAFLVALARALRPLRLPAIAAAQRRIEQASGLPHRPLTALTDRLAGGNDPAAAALWQAHRARMALATRRLRIGIPAAGLAARDPFGLRSALLLLLVIAAIAAGTQWEPRLIGALQPDFSSGPPVPPPSIDIWVTPPDYTGLPPQFLQRDYKGEAIAVPTGSTVLAQIHGGRKPPQLKLDAAVTPFTPIDAQNFKVSAKMVAGQKLIVEQDGAVLAAWPIRIVPDEPPSVEFASPPQATARAALRLEYHATDDYGVEGVKAVITRPGGPPDQKIDIDLPLPALHAKDAKNASFHDLTPHVWAGLPVEIRFIARDAVDQTGESETVKMTLPERVFQNPLARAVIDQRKQLTLDPTQRQPVSEILSDLSSRPGLFHDNIAVFLGLRMASARLILDPEPKAVAEIQQMLWDAALEIEDGQVSLAQRELRELAKRLQDALANNAPDAEIERLMNELQQAIDRYLKALAENMQRMDPDQLKDMPPIDPSRMVDRNDLQRMLDRARQLARTGAKDAARDMLAQLQEMLENLQAGRPGQMEQGGAQQQQRQAMRQMQDLMQRQQQLLDRSFRSSRQGQRGQQGQKGQRGQQGQRGQEGQQGQRGQQGQPGDQAGDQSDAAGQQEALRRMLGEMMRRMGEGQGDIPQPLGRAERAMRDAVDALNRNAPGDAVGPQTEALDQLQQAARDLAEQMANQYGMGQGDRNGKQNGIPSPRADRDPLGRTPSGNGTDEDVKIPGQADVQKSREILDELRRRAGERSRPVIERDYIDRLLKRF